MNIREKTAAVARRQYGLVTKRQALDAGLSPAQIKARVRSGEWVLLRPTVYAIAGAPVTWAATVCAAVLGAEPKAWASHQTAAALWGFPGAMTDPIEILTPLGRQARIAGVRRHRSGALFSDDLSRQSAISVTSPERTLVDLSGFCGAHELGRVLDDGLRRGLVRLERLRRCVGRLEGGPGRRPAVIHDLLAARLPGYDPGDSDLETRVLSLLASRGHPLPVQQYRVRIGGRTFKIDLAYPDLLLAIELDGWDTHRTRSAFDYDRTRANALVLAGWKLVRFTSRSTDAEILACIGTAAARFGRSGAA